MNLYEFHPYLRPNIERILSIPDFKLKTTVEIGVFQGYCTFNLTALMVKQDIEYKHYAIDPFTTSEDLSTEVISEAEKIFRENLKNFEYSDNISLMNMESTKALVNLIKHGIKADLIYIDGSHTAINVLQDLVLSWQILNPGGIILCDDSNGSWMYKDKLNYKPVNMSPRLAVENFIQCFWNEIQILDLPNNWQTAFQKI